jgi:hypothetical protein
VGVYENPPLVSHDVADDALTVALGDGDQALEPNSVLVGLALYDDDRVFVERWCYRVARESVDLGFVATAALCLGHLARRFGHLEPRSVMLVRQLVQRPDLDSRVLSALDDVTFFLEELPDQTESGQGSVKHPRLKILAVLVKGEEPSISHGITE